MPTLRRGWPRFVPCCPARSLRALPQGGCVIDTPGLRTLRLDSESGGLQAAFGEITGLSSGCRFRNCRHQGEPGCEVVDGVDEARLRNLHKLQREAARDQKTAVQRKTQLGLRKVRARAVRERLKVREGGR